MIVKYCLDNCLNYIYFDRGVDNIIIIVVWQLTTIAGYIQMYLIGQSHESKHQCVQTSPAYATTGNGRS
jgi:hypothetical protein